MPTLRPRIAIIGGGPSGLALGQLLHQRGIHATIYELRPKPTQEELAKPSGMLDLHEESGLAAMRECGLWESFQAALGDCSESTRVLNPEGVVLHTDEGGLEPRPEISRNALTKLLIENTPSDLIKWNHKIKAVRSECNPTTGATEITIDFHEHDTVVHDFVAGADGAWSRTRKLLSPAPPIYSGAQWLIATIRHASTAYPHLSALCGTGTMSALGHCNALMTQRGPQDSIRLYAIISTPDEAWTTTVGLQRKTAAEVKHTLLDSESLFANWAPALRDLLATACDEETRDNPGANADVKPYYMLPVGHRWPHRTGITLIGDAAHLMTPWAGEGVNLALWDALDLARVLAEADRLVGKDADAAAWQIALDPRVRVFEEDMLARAAEKAEESDRNRKTFLSENGAERMAEFFQNV